MIIKNRLVDDFPFLPDLRCSLIIASPGVSRFSESVCYRVATYLKKENSSGLESQRKIGK